MIDHAKTDKPTKAKIAVLLDDTKIKRWQMAALEEAADVAKVHVAISCTNSSTSRKFRKHLIYYALNAVSLRNPEARKINFSMPGCEVREFDCVYEGNWQRIPDDIVQHLLDEGIDLIVKFGMNLLKIEGALASLPVLSFHHGDPSKYRGRPAGFYELMNYEGRCGVVVQQLSNRLDAGRIFAIGHSRILYHSYRQTARNFYSISRHLLKKAVVNLQENAPLQIKTDGKIYTLPSNWCVIRFLSKLTVRKLKRFSYGAFIEKKWQVAISKRPESLCGENVFERDELEALAMGQSYRFYADPFFSADGKSVRVEALRSKTGLGEIVELGSSDSQPAKTLLRGPHYSYPFSFSLDGDEYLLPESASHSPPFILRLSGSLEKPIFLKGLTAKRLVDPTLIVHDQRTFLFFGEPGSAYDVLHLYYANSIFDAFVKHPCSPVVIDPYGARMAGRLVGSDDGLVRLGQDNRYRYGAGIIAFKIVSLDDHHYAEQCIGRMKVSDGYGPHTVDLYQERSVVDFYHEHFSVLAGYRRLASRVGTTVHNISRHLSRAR